MREHDANATAGEAMVPRPPQAEWDAGESIAGRMKERAVLLFVAIALSMLAILVVDIQTPLGIAEWVIYVVPVALALFTANPVMPLVVAAASTVLMLIGFELSPPGADFEVAVINRFLGAATVWMIALVGRYFIRNRLALRREQWLQAGETGLSQSSSGELRLEQLGYAILQQLCSYVGAPAGAFFTRDGTGFRKVATHGVPPEGVPDRVAPGGGLAWDAVARRKILTLRNVPPGYLAVGSTLGKGPPAHLVIAPIVLHGTPVAILELGFLREPHDIEELLGRLADPIGVAVRSAEYRSHLQSLLEETQRQAEALQAQTEELRVSNEELEEQGRILRESQARLEVQQTELEQANAQLEERSELLEAQRDDLKRAKAELVLRARELEQASRYKSDFLANMSHELRTPLNSTLILAKLLADNPQGNLTEEQVKYAQTIRSAGNDLLNLINDILDLSKIEAGRMDVMPEPVSIAALVEDLQATFEPLASQKGLTLRINVDPRSPEMISTDRQRLNQVLKNLLSNAVKFTEAGSVTLEIGFEAGNVTFGVIDTGIGIAREQQEFIFEAFRQADGTTNRKYGGTGLGLSIARELTRLLGGELRVASTPGKGSAFRFALPTTYEPTLVWPRESHRAAGEPEASPPPSPTGTADRASLERITPGLASDASPPVPARVGQVKDDRERLSADRRLLLVVEDDAPFARILYDLARETDFQCLIASSAEEAMNLAVQYVPNAVVLDLGLPDHSGLTVLDRLKHDVRTRHIPVHVVSGFDLPETALSLGAVGYLMKPVSREDLAEALQRIESRLVRTMRRVLIVEDDVIQRESMQSLLGTHDVETVGVATAAECLERLKSETFDCMVLDLSLPDASGYALLETLSGEEHCSFPPVIVYTGRVLSADEEQRLRRYSKSIIIKGAKSPERLLDEVTLFLHQVVSELPVEQRQMLERARSRDAAIEGRRILVVEDDVRNVFALTSVLESRGAEIQIARNGREALEQLEQATQEGRSAIDLVLMDVMMPEMDGLAAVREIRKRPEWRRLPIVMLTAKAMRDDHQRCLDAGANDYLAKPLDVEKLLSLVRVWISR